MVGIGRYMKKARSFYVADRVFKSKQALYEFCVHFFGRYRIMLDKGQFAEIVNPEDKRFALALFERHPDKERKRVSEISRILVGGNLSGGTHIELKFADGSRSSISWVRCCYERGASHKQLLLVAMRTAIFQQVSRFRNENIGCVVCGSLDNPEVDHKTKSFKELATEFLKDRAAPSNFTKCPILLQAAFLPEDYDFMESWRSFHRYNCDLQILCKKCHIIKTTTKCAKENPPPK